MANRNELTVGQTVWIRWGGTPAQMTLIGWSSKKLEALLLHATGIKQQRPLKCLFLTEADARGE